MASFNRVVIMGNLGQDPELRYTQSQMPVCTLNVATTDYRTGPDGQRQEQTEWHRVVVWSKQAENCSKYLTKGRTVLIEGRLQTRSWEDQKTGQKKYVTEIIAQNVQFVGGASQRGGERPQAAQQQGAGGYGQAGGGGGYGQASGGGGYGGQSGRYDGDLMSDQGDFGGPATPGLDDIPF